MKKKNFLAIACALLLGSVLTPLRAQESGDWSMTVGADAVSSYLWRGLELGGPSIQPSVCFDYEKGDWAVSMGVWGTKSLDDTYDELDLSLEASWRNLTFTLLDYGEDYSTPWNEGHYLDLGLSYAIDGGLTFSWYSIVNQLGEGLLDGGPGFDWASAFPSYFEVAYDFSLSVVDFTATVGVLPFASEYYGAESYGLCNMSLVAGHEFEFEHGGSLPISAQVMYNPLQKTTFWGVSVGYYFSMDF